MNSDLTLSLRGPGGLITRSHQVSDDASNWDAIVGVRGEVALPGTRWFVPYYLDVGTGSSNRDLAFHPRGGLPLRVGRRHACRALAFLRLRQRRR